MKIIKANVEDLPKILDLQYLAFESEAILLNDYNIQPLKQTLDEVKEEFNSGIILKAIDENNNIIGSIRSSLKNKTLFVAKLIVHPKYQNKGIGRALLYEIEKYSDFERAELYTSSKSAKNLNLYEQVGYRKFKEEGTAGDYKFVYMEKI
ncbi:MAG: GNAT family N-acetyltransferase [Desulfuromonadales bacterium]|nr:GNAT family N-acetyltransferase [Desulfuromonadales bacterium]